MRNTNKKGFTIVELVVVVAVIAILAAVLIPTFSGIIKKAQRSADQSAITTMNKYLAMEEANGKNANLAEAIADLYKNDVDAKDYKALSKGMNIVWSKTLNRVLYINSETKKVEYPEQYVDEAYSVGCGWYSLAGVIEEDDKWVENANGGVVEVNTGAELVSLMNAYADSKNSNNANAKAITKIELTGDIDLMGADASFGKVLNNFEISGPEGDPATIYGLRSDANSLATKVGKIDKSYGYGFIGMVGDNNKNLGVSVTISNVTFDGAVIESGTDPKAGHAGVVVGKVNYGDKLILENVTVVNSYIAADKKAGALVGYVQKSGSKAAVLELKGDITVKDNTILAAREGAAVIGYTQINPVYTDANIVSAGNTVSINKVYEGNYKYFTYENNDYALEKTDSDAFKNYKCVLTDKDFWCVVTGSSNAAVAKNFE